MRAGRIAVFMVAVVSALFGPAGSTAERPFEGFRALVVEPENSWGWDSAVFGALQERGFDVTYGAVPTDIISLSSFDLVALSIKRNLTGPEVSALKRYVAEGGALYGSWGGPMSSRGFLQEVCKVGATKSLRLKRMILLDGPLAGGIVERQIEFSERAGHVRAGPQGWEIVSVEPLADGTPVARDAGGNTLGVLSVYGAGRTAVLGFGPEQDKTYADPSLGPAMLDNLLAWLLEGRSEAPHKGWTGRITVAVPARAEVLEAYLDGRLVAGPGIRQVGSLKKVELDVGNVLPGKEADVRITYKPLLEEPDVETVIHLPWNTLRAAAGSPARLADYLESLHATVCQPLLRDSFGRAWYKGMPEDTHDEKLVAQYRGDFLADLIEECHRRRIKVVAGLYLDNAEPARTCPEALRIDRRGGVVKDQYGRACACFNNPKALEHSLATIRHLLETYEVDGIVLDDNFELDKNDCYCPYCKAGFREYCEAAGAVYEDPSQAGGYEFVRRWRQYKRDATRTLAGKVREIAHSHRVPAGGWVEVGMDATHLAGAFDLLGGMVYATPPRAARGPLSAVGECRYICLLWAPDSAPEAMEKEAREAVRAGCAAVGFWVRSDDGGYEMDAKRSQAMRAALGRVNEVWREFLRESLLEGDGRFVVVEAKLGRDEVTLRIRNTGRRARNRILGEVDM